MTLARRLAALEASRPASRAPRTPAERLLMWTRLTAYEGTVIAYYLGDWTPGDDAFRALLKGERNGRSGACKPSLHWALMRAEWKFGQRYNCLKEAFDAIGPARAELYDGLGDAFARIREIGDPVLIRIADELADTTSADAQGTAGPRRLASPTTTHTGASA